MTVSLYMTNFFPRTSVSNTFGLPLISFVVMTDALVFAEELQHGEQFAGADIFDGGVHARHQRHLMQAWDATTQRARIIRRSGSVPNCG